MSQQEKSELFRQLKAAGVEFSKHYRDYTTEELRTAWSAYEQRMAAQQPADPIEGEEADPEALAFFGQQPPGERAQAAGAARMPEPTTAQVAVADKDPHEMPGQRLNQSVELEPIRTDEQGRIWFQEEVLKPAFPKPRGRRVLQYMDGGVETRTTTDKHGFVETFEVAGVKNRRPAEVKITLPSYQVGIYKDPRFPFKVHTYNGNQGFDLFEVQNYYGGSELVPETVKKVYVENVLCYDIRTVVRAIQTEFRQLQLQGKVK